MTTTQALVSNYACPCKTQTETCAAHAHLLQCGPINGSTIVSASWWSPWLPVYTGVPVCTGVLENKGAELDQETVCACKDITILSVHVYTQGYLRHLLPCLCTWFHDYASALYVCGMTADVRAEGSCAQHTTYIDAMNSMLGTCFI